MTIPPIKISARARIADEHIDRIMEDYRIAFDHTKRLLDDYDAGLQQERDPDGWRYKAVVQLYKTCELGVRVLEGSMLESELSSSSPLKSLQSETKAAVLKLENGRYKGG